MRGTCPAVWGIAPTLPLVEGSPASILSCQKSLACQETWRCTRPLELVLAGQQVAMDFLKLCPTLLRPAGGRPTGLVV
jgi:hypothetical protein